MADPYVGEIRAVAFNYAPDGWLLCQGQILNINSYQALYTLLGNTYGGNASQGTFGLPDLQGRSILGSGAGAGLPVVVAGAKVGQTSVVLSVSQMPLHTHAAVVNDPGHNHTAALPNHTHAFSIPCDDGTAGPTSATPVGGYLSVTTKIDQNVNVAIADAQTADAAANGSDTFPPVSGTALYASAGAKSMGGGVTQGPTATGGSATGTSTTGVGVQLQTTGGVTPVSTQSPAMGLFYMIATIGIYPSRP